MELMNLRASASDVYFIRVSCFAILALNWRCLLIHVRDVDGCKIEATVPAS